MKYSMVFRRTAYRARVAGVDGVSSCVAIKYSGRDAYAAWKRDLLLFSNFQSPNAAHLFGLNRARPTLLFYDDLIPIVQVWSKSSPIIQCYIEYRLGIDMFYAWSAVDNFLDMEEISDWCDTGRFFVQRDTGEICAGPYSPYLRGPVTPLESIPMGYPEDEIISSGALPVELYRDDVSALHYLLDPGSHHPKHLDLSAELFHDVIAENLKLRREPQYPVQNVLPMSLFSVIWDEYDGRDSDFTSMIRKVARFRSISDYNYRVSTTFGSGTLLENGWIRHSLHQITAKSNRPFSSSSELFNSSIFFPRASSAAKAWLSQAFFLLDNTVHRGKRGRYGLITGLNICLVRKVDSPPSPVLTIKDIYLFIAPITSNLSSDNQLVVDWGENGTKYYYWSLDPTGSHRMSDRLCDFFGLPEFEGKVTLYMRLWQDYHYEAIRRLQLYEGFNPSTQEYAHEHELSRLDIVVPVDVIRNYSELMEDDDKNDEDLWYDAVEPEDYSSSLENKSVATWFVVPKHLRDLSGCGVRPWLQGFLPDYDLHSWRGLTSEDGSTKFCWKSEPSRERLPRLRGTSSGSWGILCSDGQIVDVSVTMSPRHMPATLKWMASGQYSMNTYNWCKYIITNRSTPR